MSLERTTYRTREIARKYFKGIAEKVTGKIQYEMEDRFGHENKRTGTTGSAGLSEEGAEAARRRRWPSAGSGAGAGDTQPLALQASHRAAQEESLGAGRISKLRSTERNYSKNKTQPVKLICPLT